MTPTLCIRAATLDPVKPPKIDLGNTGCTKFYGYDARGGRVLWRIGEQDNKVVLSYDNVIKRWSATAEDPDRFNKRQLFEQKNGWWCNAAAKQYCLKISNWKEVGPPTTTTTTVTFAEADIPWIKGEEAQSCETACKARLGKTSGCLENRWPETKKALQDILAAVGDNTCSGIDEGDWPEFPAQYDGGACYYRGDQNREVKSRCNLQKYGTARFCPCKPPPPTPAPTPAPVRRRSPRRRRSTTQPPKATMPPPPACPKSCQAPSCLSGNPINGGTDLIDGKCQKYCSQVFGENRYCGVGSDYTSGANVDCTICEPWTPPLTAEPPKPSARRRRRGSKPSGPARRRRRAPKRRRRRAPGRRRKALVAELPA